MNAIQAFIPVAVVETFATFLEFCYIVRHNIITEDSLEQLNVVLCEFHEAHQIFSGTVQEDGPLGFSLPRQHAMVHYYNHIKDFGSPNGLCSSITESKAHRCGEASMALVKQTQCPSTNAQDQRTT